MGLFKKKEEAPVEIVDKNLYILLEEKRHGIVSYLEDIGMHVKFITDDPNKLMLALIRERSPVRIVAVDFNNGAWNRKDLADNLVGIMIKYSEDDNDCTIFTSNGYIRLELGKRKVPVDLREFGGAADIVAALSSYNERYVTSGAQEYEDGTTTELLNFVHTREIDAKPSDGLNKRVKFQSRDIDILDIHVDANGESLPGFNCKF